ncbi:hypothetical protein M0811_01542 [Anaeramoeba ignava]|uniref:Pulmonary surfactant-associated protein B n=1 Tax=Anaeramoeba ignava TaxID=1746090 RepID=A0A9Q0LGM7_ANAIG|nr:hypothetical protein M0811_01542 [Anaeramoeba ignava]
MKIVIFSLILLLVATTLAHGNLKDQPPAGIQCTACEEVMKLVENFMENPKTEDEIEKFLEDVCNMLPSFLSGPCDSLVQEYLPQIINLIVNGVTPDQICSMIGLCATPPKAPKGIECTVCEMVMELLDNYLQQNHTEQEIEQFLEGVCNMLPSYLSGPCDSMIQEYLPQIINLIVNGASPDKVCSMIGLCATPKKPIGGEIECTVCDEVMKLVEKFMEDKRTEDEIEKFLEDVCNMLPSPLNTICDGLIEQYIPVIVNLLVNDYPPDKICALIGLCTSETAPKGIECTVCEMIMELLDTFLKDNHTDQEIEQFLENVCNMLPSFLSGPCDSLVQEYLPQIINLIVNGVTPDQICSMIGLCATPKAPRGIECTVCEMIMELLDNFLKDNHTDQEIEQFLENVCNMLPSFLSGPCDSLVQEYLPQIINLIVNGVTPDQICSMIGLCATPPPTPSIFKGIECTVCEIVMKLLDGFLQNNSTQQEIEQFLEGVCNMLPSYLSGPCDSLIQTYLPQIINLIVNGVTPDEICSMIGLCTSETKPKSTKCTICEETDCDDLINYFYDDLVKWFVSDFPPEQFCTDVKIC